MRRLIGSRSASCRRGRPLAWLLNSPQNLLIGKVWNRPVDLAGLIHAVVPRATVRRGVQTLYPKLAEVPKFHCCRTPPLTPPPVQHSVGWQQKSFAVPGVWSCLPRRQHVGRGIEDGPLVLVLRAVHDQVFVRVVRALAPTAAAQNLKRRTDQVSLVQREQNRLLRPQLHERLVPYV